MYQLLHRFSRNKYSIKITDFESIFMPFRRSTLNSYNLKESTFFNFQKCFYQVDIYIFFFISLLKTEHFELWFNRVLCKEIEL